MRALVLGLALISAPALAQTAEDEAQIEKLWGEHGDELSSAGILKPMYRQYHYWLTGQYILGNCAPHLREEDLLYWRAWWKDTPLENSDVGRYLLLTASETYDAGARDRLKAPLPRNQCISTALEWGKEMKRIAGGPR